MFPFHTGNRPAKPKRRPRRVQEPESGIETVTTGTGPCPGNPEHTQTRVYRIRGKQAECCCDVCGRTWSVATEHVESLEIFSFKLADSLDAAQRIPPPDGRGQDGVFIEDRIANEIAATLRRLANTV